MHECFEYSSYELTKWFLFLAEEKKKKKCFRTGYTYKLPENVFHFHEWKKGLALRVRMATIYRNKKTSKVKKIQQ